MLLLRVPCAVLGLGRPLDLSTSLPGGFGILFSFLPSLFFFSSSLALSIWITYRTHTCITH